jgi:hypothetical protein
VDIGWLRSENETHAANLLKMAVEKAQQGAEVDRLKQVGMGGRCVVHRSKGISLSLILSEVRLVRRIWPTWSSTVKSSYRR